MGPGRGGGPGDSSPQLHFRLEAGDGAELYDAVALGGDEVPGGLAWDTWQAVTVDFSDFPSRDWRRLALQDVSEEGTVFIVDHLRLWSAGASALGAEKAMEAEAGAEVGAEAGAGAGAGAEAESSAEGAEGSAVLASASSGEGLSQEASVATRPMVLIDEVGLGEGVVDWSWNASYLRKPLPRRGTGEDRAPLRTLSGRLGLGPGPGPGPGLGPNLGPGLGLHGLFGAQRTGAGRPQAQMVDDEHRTFLRYVLQGEAAPVPAREVAEIDRDRLPGVPGQPAWHLVPPQGDGVVELGAVAGLQPEVELRGGVAGPTAAAGLRGHPQPERHLVGLGQGAGARGLLHAESAPRLGGHQSPDGARDEVPGGLAWDTWQAVT